jgi:hypothetical protein
MSDTPTTPVPPVGQIATFSRLQDFRALFANQSRVTVGAGEITLTFSYLDNVPSVGQILTELTAIEMTPTHAKRLADFLTEVLKLYEATYGAIPPPSTTPFDMQKVRENVKNATGIDMPA